MGVRINNKLLWELCWIIGVGAVLLFWMINMITQETEQRMSFIADEHREQLVEYGRQAEQLYLNEEPQALTDWLLQLQTMENTWAAVAKTNAEPVAGSFLPEQYDDGFRLGRSVDWKIHLYFKKNPIMDIPFADGEGHFLIRLPQRMRPGAFFSYAQLLLQVALPLVLLCALAVVIYRHVMTPLRKLEGATRQFSDGRLDVRIKKQMGAREDELTSLADTFDQMAERISKLITEQRQLLADLSHEMRTPLTRIDTAIECMAEDVNPQQALQRLRYESSRMRELVEDTLTLAWMNNETPQLNQDSFDLVELVQAICDDAGFEYPERQLLTELPEEAALTASSQRALGQALENIIRNALSYTPEQGEVRVTLKMLQGCWHLCVRDQGPGVPEHLYEDIFRPFFQVERSRTAAVEPIRQGGGFGLGLALAKRQVLAVGGDIAAENYCRGAVEDVAGLQITIRLPR